MDLQHLRASDGTGEAVLAHVDATRTIGSTVLSLDNVDNWNTDAIVVTGTPAANGFVSPTGMTIMYGHLNAGDFIIDGYAPGYSDAGNTTAEVAIIKMTTSWADTLVDILKIAHNDDGTIKDNAITTEAQFTDNVDPAKRTQETIFDHVASGCVLTGTGYGSTLAWSLTAGVVYINGRRLTVAAATGVVVATKDTYFDLLDPGTGTVATLVYTGGNSVTVNAASPALAANSVRIAIIQSGANIASVAAVNQGEQNKLLPIASSNPYAVTDSLGNLICPRDPNRKVLGYREINSNVSSITATTPTAVTGLSVPVIVPTGRKVKITVQFERTSNTNNGSACVFGVYDTTVAAANTLAENTQQIVTGGQASACGPAIAFATPTTNSKTYAAGVFVTTGTGSFAATALGGGGKAPAFIMVELE